MNYATGQDNYGYFLGYLKNELQNKLDGLSDKEKEIFVKEILEREYKQYKTILDINLEDIKSKWASIENQFFIECTRIFDGNPFPEGKYIAIESIWGRYPCIIEDKKFSFPANKQLMMLVVIHELLHFAFYDYLKKNPNNQLNENQLWVFSEILNTVVMNREPFLSWAGEKSVIYPALQAKYKKLDPIYDLCKYLNEFIEKSVSILKD